MAGRSTRSLGSAKTVLDIGILAAGGYFMDGAYGISEASFPMPLQARIKVELMSNALDISGTWQQHSGRPTHAFNVQFLRDHASQSQADVLVSGTFIRNMKGRVSLLQPAYEILAADESREQLLSCHFSPSQDRGIFEVSGFIAMASSAYYSFQGQFVPTEGRAAISNVVRVIGGKVA
jgi:hypothetical protein